MVMILINAAPKAKRVIKTPQTKERKQRIGKFGKAIHIPLEIDSLLRIMTTELDCDSIPLLWSWAERKKPKTISS